MLFHCLAALAGDDREQQTAYLFESVSAILCYFLSQDRLRSLVPAHALANFAKSILEFESSILSRAARVRFANIGLDAADRRLQLGRNFDGDDVGLEFCSVCKRILNEGFGDLMRAHPVERVVRIVDGYGDVMCHASKMTGSPRRLSPDPAA